MLNAIAACPLRSQQHITKWLPTLFYLFGMDRIHLMGVWGVVTRGGRYVFSTLCMQHAIQLFTRDRPLTSFDYFSTRRKDGHHVYIILYVFASPANLDLGSQVRQST